MKHHYRLLFILLALAIMIGCSNGHKRLCGRVVYSDTGEPLECGTVIFVTDTFQARGNIKENGRFDVGSFKVGDGLPSGTYKVLIIDAVIQGKLSASGTLTEKILIDHKYGSSETSGLSFVVDGKQREFDISVDRAAAKKK